MIQRSSGLFLEYITSHQLFETQKIKLKISNEFGIAENVKVFFNKYGQYPGEDGCYEMIYNSQESTENETVFVAQFQHGTVGYRTFVIALQLNNKRMYVKRDYSTCEPVLTEFIEDDRYAFWETMPYSLKYDTPDCGLEGGIAYQIYPDTFYRKNLPEQFKDKVVSWDAPPKWWPDEDGEYRNDQYYGGTIAGIIEKLPHIKSLGVTAIYICPVLKSGSSNRYDTIDYETVDPILGTWDDMAMLYKKVHEYGMNLGIDVVINHSSILNPLLKEAPQLYKWKEWLVEPKCWWDYKHLPEFDQSEQEYLNYATKWLKNLSKYCDFFRFDVADSLESSTIRHLKSQLPNVNFMGEVWKHAITGEHRTFLNGEELDCVMNYQFAYAIYRYARWGNGEYFKRITTNIYNLYPERALRRSPIFISSHDIPRPMNILTNEYMKEDESYENVWDMEKSPDWIDPDGTFNTYRFRKYEMENLEITGETRTLAENLRRIAVFLQYTLPGLPSIFAGDEMGETGLKDPTNKFPLPWDNIDVKSYELYKNLGIFRNDHRATFAYGDYEVLEENEGKLLYRRADMLFAVNITDKDADLFECMKNKNIVFSMGENDKNCDGEVKLGLLPRYSVVAVKS
ncbi:MAG: hypothetical protein IKL55_00950 [Clostridia bacterium]|nr:hypothetical protein [Clostridia bacterium]